MFILCLSRFCFIFKAIFHILNSAQVKRLFDNSDALIDESFRITFHRESRRNYLPFLALALA